MVFPLAGASGLNIQTIHDSTLDDCGINLRIARLDQLHPLLSGNKWFKLRRNLQFAKSVGATTLLSFGGAYSNHIHALAAAGRLFDFRTIGVIRGEICGPLNPTLSFAEAQGMMLLPVSRTEYRQRHDPVYLDELQARFGERVYLIPEGGANLLGVQGCMDIAQLLADEVSDLEGCEILLACGTGTTLAGLVAGLQKLYGLQSMCTGKLAMAAPRVRGFAVLKGADFLRKSRCWLGSGGRLPSWRLCKVPPSAG
jgi:1-aminocyclopropane-1-carboxylate deaminase